MQEPLEISEGILGSPMSYTLTYFGRHSGVVCGSYVINTNSCVNGTCNHTFDVTSSCCPKFSGVNVTVYATNILGNGSIITSQPSSLGNNCLIQHDVRYYTKS